MNNSVNTLSVRFGFLKPFLFLIGFYLIYQPNFWGLEFSYVPAVLTVAITLFLALLLPPKTIGRVYKNIKVFTTGVVLSLLYFVFRATLAGQDNRLFQNGMILVNVFSLLLFIEFLRVQYQYNSVNILKWLLYMVVVQCIVAILMLLDDSLRSIIISKTASGVMDNQFIYGARLYGLSGDYTFFTPIYHSLLGIVAVYLGMNVNKRFYFFVPFCFFIILLNGRTGLVTLFIGITILLLSKSISNQKGLFQSFLILIIGVAGVAGGLYALNIVQPTTYKWIMSGFQDTLALLFQGNTTGNYEQLAGTFLTFPRDLIHWLFGYGLRVYGGNASSLGFSSSDIGYINDLFMGGIFYIGVLYLTIFLYSLKLFKASSVQIKKSGIYIAFLMVFLIANYKGEAARSGLILYGMIAIEYILMIPDKKVQ